ncbi:MAG: decarboxylating NADP(+)-dependent phosphogluconate dehydrogenase [Desulfobulbaceae bacterium]|jgi:6-phosphogluconate dehydrogenase|nr:decarboxylating NADP(+)-dependent phosphogluconate dehydrogenase [Desulfobulbaceae bacterium]MDH3782910.1 decarboxylating NADP(+)-dependent phosphogluconate dehydrogenase [Desulfobulbaceae bacterium]PLX52350.1 MAG: phosphogluconate dehydrogenase (NADP(+)-dependent, decarboxylating) [Desulfobulbaceae bacterium]
MAQQCDIGLIGLAVMGQNLILNMADHGYQVAAFNRTTSRVDEFLAWPAQGKSIVGCRSLEEFVRNLKKPRIAMLMVKAGDPVKQTVKQLAPLLEPGDIIIDGGNSCFLDTEEQIKELQPQGILYMGTGISGGEEGARHGPSIMPGGVKEAWPHVRPIFQAIAAKVGPNNDIPCCDWVGAGGAGHYVKMVHNGIEYGDMQLISEAYSLLKDGLGLNNDELYDVFDEWNRGELDSYLIEITRDIFSVIDDKTGKALVDMILDKAGQKGTGKWTAQHAMDLGVPTTLITEAVFARTLSALKEQRVRAGKVLTGPAGEPKEFRLSADREDFVNQVRKALFASKVCSYTQGFFQLQAASKEFDWELEHGAIAMLWRGGCIIRAAFLEDIKKAYDRNPQLENLLFDEYFSAEVIANQKAWRQVVCTAARLGLPVPAMSAALNYYDSYRSARLPHNLLQAQRDYFGAHTYERVDEEGSFHTDWGKLKR